MSDTNGDTPLAVDIARLPLLLGELRLPTFAALWRAFTDRADREGWPSARLLAALAELELGERARRRVQRHLLEARLPPGKTLDGFDFAAVPMIPRARISALAGGDGWLDKGSNTLLFGPSGSGKSHLAAALGHASSRTAIACCSPAPPISSSACKPRVRPWPWRARSRSSTNTISSCSTTYAM